jgi:CHAT domain-containing protein
MRGSVLLALCAAGLSLLRGAAEAPPQTPRERAVRQTVAKFFAAYGEKDLDGLMALWHPDAPDRERVRKELATLFSQTGPVTVKVTQTNLQKLKGNRARLEVELLVEGKDVKSGKPIRPLGTSNWRIVELVREDSAWKVWKFERLAQYWVEIFARELTTKEERIRSLKEEERPILVQRVAVALNHEAFLLAKQEQFVEALRLSDLAGEVADFLDSQEHRAWVALHRVLVLANQKKHLEAAEQAAKALAGFRHEGQELGEAMALCRQGRALIQLGRTTEAVKVFDAADKLIAVLVYTADRNVDYIYARHFLRSLEQIAHLEDTVRRLSREGRATEALKEFEELLRLEQSIYGEVHRRIANSHSWIARLLAELGNFDQALQASDKALAVMTQLYGEKGERVVEHRLRRQWIEKLHALTASQRQKYWDAEKERRRSQQLQAQKNFVEAEKIRRDVVAVRRELLGKISDVYVDAVQELAYALELQKKYTEAVALHREVDPTLRKLFGEKHTEVRSNLQDLASTLFSQAEEQVRNGEFPAACDSVRQCLEVRERLGESIRNSRGKTVGELRWYLAHVERLARLPASKQTLLRDALAEQERLTAELSSRESWSWAPQRLATALKRVETIRQTLLLHLGETDYAHVANAELLVRLCARMPPSQHAEEVMQQVNRLVEQTGLKGEPIHAMCQAVHALMAAYRGDNEQAFPLLQVAYDTLRRSLGEEDQTVTLLREMVALGYMRGGQLQRGNELLRRAAQYYKAQIQGEDARDDGIYHLSSVKTLATSRQREFLLGYARCCSLMATLQLKGGKPKEAERCLHQNLIVIRQVYGENNSNYTEALVELADFHSDLGDLVKAERTLQQARDSLGPYEKADPRVAGKVLVSLGDLYRERGNYQAAEEVQRLAADLLRKRFGVSSFSTSAFKALARTLQAQGKDEALGLMQEVLVTEQQLFHSRFGFASERTAQMALGPRGIGALGLRLDDLATAVAAKPEPARVEQLWTWVLRRRGVVLDSLCRFREAELALAADPKLDDLAARLRGVQAKLGELETHPPPGLSAELLRRQRHKLQDEESRLEIDLKRELSKLRPEQLVPGTDVSLSEIHRKLSAGTALVEFVRYEPIQFRARHGEQKTLPARYLALILVGGKKNPPRLVDLGEADPIDRAVQELVGQLKDFPRARKEAGEKHLEQQFRRTSADLYDRLLARVRRGLEDCHTLLIVPDGDLHLLPFAALVEGKEDRAKYLLESCRIGYLSAGRDLLRPVVKPADGGVVIFAGPNFDLSPQERLKGVKALPPRQRPGPTDDLILRGPARPGAKKPWTPLEGAEPEAEAIREVLGKTLGLVTVYPGADALEERVKAVRSPRILHLATHGFFFARVADKRGLGDGLMSRLESAHNPMLRSGLVFAGANRPAERGSPAERLEDGWLTAEEVALLDLRGTDLVVLSACQSGQGEVRGSEGVYGLRRAFLYAGARTVVATLFSIPDKEATPALVKAFYRSLAQEKGKLEALHQAQLEVLRQRREKGGAAHPFYWAGFVLVGETGNERRD